jgi:hypothetical protein
MEDNLFTDIDQFLQNKNQLGEPVLTEEEVQFLIVNILEGAGEKGQSEENILKIINWVSIAKLNETIINLVFKGYTYIGWDEASEDVTVKLTEKGKAWKTFDQI